ncbi:hypothetical protein [Pyrococcus kukulkanii]|uniref:Uncharacterized protein n=1 Tax=Pyrococcus kukulkanii TaxID=1609559 RepID=A0A127BA22_9EURY|nr:hypothetical protein [Pyrococcus kukulkanii]AMM54181.1 hypothetical protein TQ32_06600 [Pyrococcus kukulkanii]
MKVIDDVNALKKALTALLLKYYPQGRVEVETRVAAVAKHLQDAGFELLDNNTSNVIYRLRSRPLIEDPTSVEIAISLLEGGFVDRIWVEVPIVRPRWNVLHVGEDEGIFTRKVAMKASRAGTVVRVEILPKSTIGVVLGELVVDTAIFPRRQVTLETVLSIYLKPEVVQDA